MYPVLLGAPNVKIPPELFAAGCATGAPPKLFVVVVGVNAAVVVFEPKPNDELLFAPNVVPPNAGGACPPKTDELAAAGGGAAVVPNPPLKLFEAPKEGVALVPNIVFAVVVAVAPNVDVGVVNELVVVFVAKLFDAPKLPIFPLLFVLPKLGVVFVKFEPPNNGFELLGNRLALVCAVLWNIFVAEPNVGVADVTFAVNMLFVLFVFEPNSMGAAVVVVTVGAPPNANEFELVTVGELNVLLLLVTNGAFVLVAPNAGGGGCFEPNDAPNTEEVVTATTGGELNAFPP